MTNKEFIEIVNSSISMAEAARKLGMNFSTFRGKANRLGVYNPNQGLKCGNKKPNGYTIPLSEILEGKHPQYQTSKLRRRLIDEGIFQDKCFECDFNMKRDNEKYSVCELHHIDGDNTNHRLKNLIILCPNHHALTPNFRNIKRN